MKNIHVRFILLCLVMFGASGAEAQVGSPMQAGHYYPGLFNLRDLSTPTPGLYVVSYNWFLSSNGYYNKDGNQVTQVQGTLPNGSPVTVKVNPSLNSFAAIPMFMYTSNLVMLKKVMGGARYFAGVAPIYMSAKASLAAEGHSTVKDTTYSKTVSVTNSGLSDMIVTPLGLSWWTPKFDLSFVYSMYLPTGRYATGATDNLGLGFLTNQLQLFSYIYLKGDRNKAFLLGFTYELNGTKKDIDVKPGNRFSLEYGYSHYFTERYEMSLKGSNNMQMSDDTGSAVYWDKSIHDKKGIVGLSAGYWVWKDRLELIAKYNYEYGAVQRFQNNNVLVNLVFVTNALRGKSGK